jgi:hypothetical protein
MASESSASAVDLSSSGGPPFLDLYMCSSTLNKLRYVVILQVLVATWKMKQDPGVFHCTCMCVLIITDKALAATLDV